MSGILKVSEALLGQLAEKGIIPCVVVSRTEKRTKRRFYESKVLEALEEREANQGQREGAK